MKKPVLGTFWEWVVPIIIVAVIFVLFRIFVFDIDVVRGTSMCSTLYDGDIILATKYRGQEISRGDIVTVYVPEEEAYVMKRVVALPGEEVNIDNDGFIYIDGEKIDEYQQKAPVIGTEYEDVILSDDEYYVLGDNRYNSLDSRNFGPVNSVFIKDIAKFRFYPITML